tara:strand:- start:298 stop:459 length:162 start_codon:yes stop_codon:yes gene_type:complete
MVIPSLFLTLLVWYLLGKPDTEPLETIVCNGIPLLSIGTGLFFGWVTGSEYAE